MLEGLGIEEAERSFGGSELRGRSRGGWAERGNTQIVEAGDDGWRLDLVRDDDCDWSSLYPSVAAEHLFSAVDSGGLTLGLDFQRYRKATGELQYIVGKIML